MLLGLPLSARLTTFVEPHRPAQRAFVHRSQPQIFTQPLARSSKESLSSLTTHKGFILP